MAYSSDILTERVKFYRKHGNTQGKFGTNSGGITYDMVAERWANVTWSKGVKSMREGAMDAYDTIMVRLHYDPAITRDSFLQHDNRVYNIDSFHADKRENTIQITATERPEKELKIYKPEANE